MTLIVDVTAEDARWAELGLAALSQRAAVATLKYLGIDLGFEISLLACGDARISELNAEFRDKGGATNVLSWPSEERAADTDGGTPIAPTPDPQLAQVGAADELGDIAISYDTCAREALAEGKPVADHVSHLMVHGVLHLLGYDHIRDKDATLMEGLEREILETLGIPDPYKTEH